MRAARPLLGSLTYHHFRPLAPLCDYPLMALLGHSFPAGHAKHGTVPTGAFDWLRCGQSGAWGVPNTAGGWANCPGLPVFSSTVPFHVWGQNCQSPQLPTKASTPRFSPAQVYESHPARQRGTTAVQGNKPWDGGYLVLPAEERDGLLAKRPECEKYVKPFISSYEFII